LRIGSEFGLRAIRVPAEPPDVMAMSDVPGTLAARSLYAWSSLLRRRACHAGVATAGAVFGITWSGHMTADRLLRLLPNLPDGCSEIYFHPAARRDAAIGRLMPDYEHEAEMATLTNPELRAMLSRHGIVPCGYGELV
jgi:chitin disaccharide deacetylase